MKQSGHDESNYFVTFTDDFSRATMVYCIKQKNEVMEKFLKYIEMAETMHGKDFQKCVWTMVASILQMNLRNIGKKREFRNEFNLRTIEQNFS